MNSHRLMKAVGLYAKIKRKKKTGLKLAKMRRILALSKKSKTPRPCPEAAFTSA